MVMNARKSILFAGGLLLGVLAGAAGMMSLRGGDGPYASSPAPGTRTMGAAASTAFVTAVAGNCDMAPMLPRGGDDDGHETLKAKPGEGDASEIASLILSGKEAAASGRQRDAEVDFLNACRQAASLQDGDPIPLADAMYQLGRLYATVGALGGAKPKDPMYQRAERLYSASLEAYRARYGEGSEKTRFAQEGLATVQQATGGKPPAVIAKAPPPPPAPAPAAAPEAAASSSVADAPAPAPAPAQPAAVAAAQPAPAPAAPAQKPAVPARVAKAPVKPTPEPEVAKAPVKPAPAPEVAKAPTETDKPLAQSPRAAPPVREASVREEPVARHVEPAPPRIVEQPRRQARRTPEQAPSTEPEEVVLDAPPPRPRRPRLQPDFPAESQSAPDTASAGYGGAMEGGTPSAEGSPNAQ